MRKFTLMLLVAAVGGVLLYSLANEAGAQVTSAQTGTVCPPGTTNPGYCTSPCDLAPVPSGVPGQNVVGTNKSDKITTGNGDDTINAKGCNDKIKSNGGADNVTAGSGNDKGNSGARDDIVPGRPRHDPHTDPRGGDPPAADG